MSYRVGIAEIQAAWDKSYAMPNVDQDDYLRLGDIDPDAARTVAQYAAESAREAQLGYDDAVIESFLMALDLGVRIGERLRDRSTS